MILNKSERSFARLQMIVVKQKKNVCIVCSSILFLGSTKRRLTLYSILFFSLSSRTWEERVMAVGTQIDPKWKKNNKWKWNRETIKDEKGRLCECRDWWLWEACFFVRFFFLQDDGQECRLKIIKLVGSLKKVQASKQDGKHDQTREHLRFE